MKLPKIVEIDTTKCVNCHKCISVCPVKYCNDGSGDYINLNHDMCIGCGNCIKACTHQARTIVDDFSSFIKDITNGHKMVAFAAPSVVSNWPGQYLRFNGWLKSLGIDAVFDVSFGAELTTRSIVHECSSNNSDIFISQACPVAVSYIQIYLPELIPYLFPVDSPMVHSMKMVREFFPKYKDHRFAIISPCIAKKREFSESGVGDYNITFISIMNYLKKNGVDLARYPEISYDGPSAERGVMFPTPGGLTATVQRDMPDFIHSARKIEGAPEVYEYLKQIRDRIQKDVFDHKLVIDCLNCGLGCNGGTGTKNITALIDEIDRHIINRRNEVERQHRSAGFLKGSKAEKEFFNNLKKYWNEKLYCRSFIDMRENYAIVIPTPDQLKEIYVEMKKFSETDFYNCSSCGYGTCENMAIAIFNNLNRPQNCHYFQQKVIEEDNLVLRATEKELTQYKKKLEDKVAERTRELKLVNDKLQIEIEGHKKTELMLRDSEQRLKMKLDYITTAGDEPAEFGLIDLIDLAALQEIQDAFATASDVASIITDPNGEPITNPSNFCKVCTMIRSTETGAKNCGEFNRRLGEKAKKSMSPSCEVCRNCGFLHGSAPIIVAGKYVANWVIGQINIGKTDVERMKTYGASLGIPPEKLTAAYKALPLMNIDKFHQVLDLLGCFAKKLSLLGFNNLKLARNIYEREQLENEMLKTRKLESIGILAGGIAHDFNNLLTSILGNLSLAEYELNNSNTVLTDYLKNAEKATMRAKELSQQLLTFSKGGTPVKSTTAIEDLIKETADFALKGTKVKCEYNFGDSIWPVDIDQGQISQVLNNLIINAVQAMPDGGIIRIGCRNVNKNYEKFLKEDKYIQILIADQGVGIPEDHLERIFDPYFTTKEKGNGLGLATSHSIITKHNGHLTVKSRVGVGTMFTIYLPASSTKLKSSGKENLKYIKGKGRILVMDDDDLILHVFKQGLTTLGYDVTCVVNGEQALEEFRNAFGQEHPYDLVIMDLTIPGAMGGKEAIKLLKESYPDARAVVASGYSNDPVMSDYTNYGFCGYIKKPFNINELSCVLYSLLNEQ